MARVLTAKGLEYLASVPVGMQEDPDVQAVLHCYAKEEERRAAAREQMMGAVVTPARADDRTIGIWERLLGLEIAPAGASLATRQQTASAYLVALRRSGTGSWWEETLQRIAPGATYTESGSGVIDVELPFSGATAAFARAVVLIGRVTDAHLTVNYTSALSFRLDVSKFDLGLLP